MIRFIETCGTPRQMGEQYGEAMRREIHLAQELWSEWFRKHPVADDFVRNVRYVLNRYAPDVLEEFSGLSAGADTDENFLFAINFTDTFDDETERCTPMFLRSSPDGVIVAKNNDAPQGESFPFVIRRGKPDRGLPFLQITYAGWLSGLDMMNAEGLADTHASVGSFFSKKGLNMDIRLRMYQLMQSCRTAKELALALREVPLTGKGFAVAVGDAQNDALFLDAAVPKIAVRAQQEDFAWAANLYMSPEVCNADTRPVNRRDHCLKRYEYIGRQPVPRTMEQIRRLLCDHSSPYAPCRHGGEALSVTTWSMIALPQKRAVYYTDGNPCVNLYKEIIL
ncbi:MAG: C45 family autoproteolytic acyltransferase/hydrolase [Victivallales bacterium]